MARDLDGVSDQTYPSCLHWGNRTVNVVPSAGAEENSTVPFRYLSVSSLTL